jgi:hypothetical protein
MSDTPIPLEQATSLVRPGTYNREFGLWENGGPWTWADPIQAIVSDSYKWRSWADLDAEWGPYENRVAQSAIENLYRCGYALVKVSDQ